MKLSLIIGCFLLIPALRSNGTLVDLGTANAGNWLITGAGATAAPAKQVTGTSEISLTDDSLRGGNFITGGSSAAFTGLWYADRHFFIPSNATGISLTFSLLRGDDRLVLQLNGVVLADYFLNATDPNSPRTGVGVMEIPPSTSDTPFTFTGVTAGTITSGLLTGADNDLRIVVNNTHSSVLTSPTITYNGPGEGTWASLNASVSYVPEPGAIGVIAAGALLGLFRRGRRQPK